MLIIDLILLAATSLLFWKLVTTNHWTSGKKNLVAIVTCLLWQRVISILYMMNLWMAPLSVVIMVANAPLAISIVSVALIVHWFDK